MLQYFKYISWIVMFRSLIRMTIKVVVFVVIRYRKVEKVRAEGKTLVFLLFTIIDLYSSILKEFCIFKILTSPSFMFWEREYYACLDIIKFVINYSKEQYLILNFEVNNFFYLNYMKIEAILLFIYLLVLLPYRTLMLEFYKVKIIGPEVVIVRTPEEEKAWQRQGWRWLFIFTFIMIFYWTAWHFIWHDIYHYYLEDLFPCDLPIAQLEDNSDQAIIRLRDLRTKTAVIDNMYLRKEDEWTKQCLLKTKAYYVYSYDDILKRHCKPRVN